MMGLHLMHTKPYGRAVEPRQQDASPRRPTERKVCSDSRTELSLLDREKASEARQPINYHDQTTILVGKYLSW